MKSDSEKAGHEGGWKVGMIALESGVKGGVVAVLSCQRNDELAKALVVDPHVVLQLCADLQHTTPALA